MSRTPPHRSSSASPSTGPPRRRPPFLLPKAAALSQECQASPVCGFSPGQLKCFQISDIFDAFPSTEHTPNVAGLGMEQHVAMVVPATSLGTASDVTRGIEVSRIVALK